MPTETILGASRRVALLERSAVALAPAGVIVTKLRVEGYHRIKGNFHVDNPPANGFPRVEQSVDGITFSLVSILQQDPTQADIQFPFDIQLRLPYVRVRYTQGGVGATFINAWVYVVPHYGVGDDAISSVDGKVQFIRSDKDVDLIGAIAAGSQVIANLANLNSNVGVIESISLLAEQNLDYEIHIWSSDGFDDADEDLDDWIEFVAFAVADGVSIGNATPATFRYAATALSIPYQDKDGTMELHISLVPRGAVAKLAAGAGGNVVLEFAFRAQA